MEAHTAWTYEDYAALPDDGKRYEIRQLAAASQRLYPVSIGSDGSAAHSESDAS